MFPLFRCEGCFQLLESAYVVLFSEIFAVIFVLHKNGYAAHLFYALFSSATLLG